MSLVALVLVERGELNVHAPVARYWPEFAANGKADIEVRHLMSHTSGVPAWEQKVTVEDLYDWEKSTARLATQALPYLPDRKICFWGGYGGSAIVIDVERRAVFSYVMNRMGAVMLNSGRTTRYTTAFFADLG